MGDSEYIAQGVILGGIHHKTYDESPPRDHEGFFRRVIFALAAATLVFSLSVTAQTKPPGSCTPWPTCKDGGGGSGDVPAFFETCATLDQWTVTGKWSTSKGQCSAKNTDAARSMVTANAIDLSGAAEAQLSYTYRIQNADPGEYMEIACTYFN